MLEELEDSAYAISARLKCVRTILRMNQREFALHANMSEQAYGAFENGKRDLSLVAAKKLRKAFGLSLEFLYFGKIDDLPTRLSREILKSTKN